MFNIEVKKVKLVNGSTLIGGLINDGIFGKNYITLGDPADLKIKKKQMKMNRCIDINEGVQMFNIPNDMIVKISEPDVDTFQMYHDQIITDTVLNKPKIH